MTTSTQSQRYTKPVLTYPNAISKGERLLDIMHRNIFTPSQFLKQDDLERWGWGYSEPSPTNVIPEHTRLIKALSPKTNPNSQAHASATVLRFDMHDEDVTVDGVYYPLTRGCFYSAMNPDIGVLIACFNTNPAGMTDQHGHTDPKTMILPKLQHWSDVAFLQWQSLSDEGVIPDLKYIIRSHIQNADCVGIIKSNILPTLRQKLNRRTSWLPMWPGIDFDMTSEEAKALLGTPNGSGVAWLLAQHKEELGQKTVEKATLWYSLTVNPSDREGIPNLLFHLKDLETEEREGSEVQLG